MASPAGARVLSRRYKRRGPQGAPGGRPSSNASLNTDQNLAEGVAHKVHRLWDRVKHPACGLVDNASQNLLLAVSLSPTALEQPRVRTTKKVQGARGIGRSAVAFQSSLPVRRENRPPARAIFMSNGKRRSQLVCGRPNPLAPFPWRPCENSRKSTNSMRFRYLLSPKTVSNGHSKSSFRVFTQSP